MEGTFLAVADRLMEQLRPNEVLLLDFYGEQSDFVRLNHNRIRQAGTVTRRHLGLDLIEGRRHASAELDLSGHPGPDVDRLRPLLQSLRTQRAHLPEDPHLNFAAKPESTHQRHDNPQPDSEPALGQIMTAAEGMDLVGIWASGAQYAGFANSLGQRNWHSTASFNLDWSCYHDRDKAVKSALAGFRWEPAALDAKMAAARTQLTMLGTPPKTLEPGRYRVYLAPTALAEIMTLLAWGGFGLKSHRTDQSPLIKMRTEGRRLSPAVTLSEHRAGGLVPSFTGTGFTLPPQINLVENGSYRDCLTGPRSAREYGVAVNAGTESAQALTMDAGTLGRDDLLTALDTGLYVSNLWYTNFSDRNDARITGMTRFACLWVENGVIQGPVNVMRFDESVYRMLGARLEALTAERELIADSSSYGRRSNRSMLLPGALIAGMTFTL
ncbi:MAG: metallopeptidase TldD-related protein [Gammaproteobacteria bacterium]